MAPESERAKMKVNRKKTAEPLFDLRHVALAFGVDEQQLRRGKEVPLERGKRAKRD